MGRILDSRMSQHANVVPSTEENFITACSVIGVAGLIPSWPLRSLIIPYVVNKYQMGYDYLPNKNVRCRPSWFVKVRAAPPERS